MQATGHFGLFVATTTHFFKWAFVCIILFSRQAIVHIETGGQATIIYLDSEALIVRKENLKITTTLFTCYFAAIKKLIHEIHFYPGLS